MHIANTTLHCTQQRLYCNFIKQPYTASTNKASPARTHEEEASVSQRYLLSQTKKTPHKLQAPFPSASEDEPPSPRPHSSQASGLETPAHSPTGRSPPNGAGGGGERGGKTGHLLPTGRRPPAAHRRRPSRLPRAVSSAGPCLRPPRMRTEGLGRGRRCAVSRRCRGARGAAQGEWERLAAGAR